MRSLHDCKFVQVIQPAAIVDNASWTTVEIDTIGFNRATFVFSLGASDIAMAALKVQESDTSGAGMADIVGTRFGTDNNTAGSASTLPSATDDNKIFIIDIDLKGRKRYLDMVATAGDGAAGSYASCVCVLSKAAASPKAAAGEGASQVLRC